MTDMTDEQIELTRRAARNLLAHRDAGRRCAPEGIRWAERVLGVISRPATDNKFRCQKCGEAIHLWGTKWETVDGVRQRLGRCCKTTQVFRAKETA